VALEQVERKLATILAAEIAGYSRLMAADEQGTVARIKSLCRELIDPKIEEYRGRIIKKSIRDGVLVEFASVEDAVRCAVDVQKVTADRNADVSEDRQMLFRLSSRTALITFSSIGTKANCTSR